MRRGAPDSQYQYIGSPDEEDDNCLMMPGNICPHNQPWGTEFKQL